MNHLIKFLFIVLCFNAGASYASQDSVSLKNSAHYYVQLKPYTKALITSPNTPLEVLKKNSSAFQPINTPYINFGAVEHERLWLKSSLINESDEKGTWRLDINRQYYMELDVYLVKPGGSIQQVIQHTRTANFTERAIQDRMLGVDLVINPQEKIDIYAALRSNTSTFFPWAIGTVEGVLLEHRKENLSNWTINGALLTFIIFSLMITFVVGWRISVSFSCYILAGLIYILHTDGYLFATLWPNKMAWNDPLNLSFMLMMSIAGLAFARALFDFKSKAPRFDRFILGVIVLALIAALCSFYVFEYRILKIIAYLLTPLGSVTQFVAASIALKQNLLGAKPYFMGALIILVSMVYAIVGHTFSGYFNLDTTLDFGHIALISESLAFAAAITLRLIGLRDERDQALASELKLTRSRLELSSELQKAQEDFSDARKKADVRRAQLASVGHDIQQPLNSLRQAISNLTAKDEAATQQMLDAFDYLENLAKSQMPPTGGNSSSVSGHATGSTEVFPVSSVLDNIYAMYLAEAKANDIEMNYRPHSGRVIAEPIGLMRAVGNLVSNAIKHSQADKILLAARNRGSNVIIEVWDNGVGGAEGANQLRHSVPQGEVGHGLGLSLVRSFATESGVKFTLESPKGKGTVARLLIPAASENLG